MTTVLNLNLNDLSTQFVQKLKQKFGKAAAVEIHLYDKSPADDLFSETDFWTIINAIDWSKKATKDKLKPAIERLSEMPISNIYLFADKLSEKLYFIDTKLHAQAYAAQESDNFISVDDFLYARCAVVAEGQDYYEKILHDPSLMPHDIVFEPLLSLADFAYEIKIGMEFNYRPTYNYETHSNQAGWL
jgi:Protein of unknown function (DUF4240)